MKKVYAVLEGMSTDQADSLVRHVHTSGTAMADKVRVTDSQLTFCGTR